METTTFPKSSSGANASSASAGASAGIESAKSSFSKGIDKSAAPARQAVDRFSSFAHETVDKVADVANRYSDVPTKALDTSKTWVQDRPMVAVGAALVLGLVIGRLTSN
jgi:ElaB/YqjD/DUF883 family membrane-anchored ribosome-binding protein